MVFVWMLCKHPFLALTSGLVIAFGSVGCVGNKNKDVAETPLAAPPAAAYPDSPSNYPDSTGTAPPASTPHDYAATNSSTNSSTNASSPAPSAPVFELRSGEQLITHSIVKGDTLGGIASHYNSSQSRIMAANGMTNTKIYAGKTLQVPTSAPPAELAMNGAGAGAAAPRTGAAPYPAPAAASPYSRAGSSPYSAPGASPYSPPAPVAPVTPPTSYGSGSYGSSTTGGTYPSPTSAPAPAPAPVQPTYSTNAPSPPVVPSSPSTTSFPRVQNAPAPPQAGGSFPTPNLSSGSGQVQFSN